MSLRETLQNDLKEAMRQRDDVRRSVLRLALTAIKNAEVEAGAPLDDEAIQRVLRQQVKQRRESIEEFERGNRPDLVAREQAEIGVLQTYLPQQLSRDEIVAMARRVIADTGATSPRDLGKVMPRLMAEVDGRAEGRTVNQIVQELLAGRAPSQ